MKFYPKNIGYGEVQYGTDRIIPNVVNNIVDKNIEEKAINFLKTGKIGRLKVKSNVTKGRAVKNLESIRNNYKLNNKEKLRIIKYMLAEWSKY